MNIKLLDRQKMPEVFTGSGIGFFEDQLYVTGTDATRIMVMDKSWEMLDTIELLSSDANKMPSAIKAQFTAITTIQAGNIPYLLMLASGIVEDAPYKGILMNIRSGKMEELDLSVFYNRIKHAGFESLDITALTVMDDKLVLCNRRNNDHSDNHIIITSDSFWKNQHAAELTVVKIEFEQYPDKEMTACGLTYSYKNDWLILTVFGKSMQQAAENGLTGDSYLGVIEDASRKIGRKRIKSNTLFNLSEVSENLIGQQVGPVCMQADKEQKLKLHIVTEDGNGETSFFKIRLKE